jgi:ssDNA-binding Zn-finger/Zn-ribbon topoisomerase 1
MPLYDPDKAPFCPACGVRMVERRGPYGPFFGCKKYPDCEETVNLDDFDHSNF